MVKDFVTGEFPRSWFQSWLLLLDLRKELIYSLLIADWLIFYQLLLYNFHWFFSEFLIVHLSWYFEQFAYLSNHTVLFIWYPHAMAGKIIFSCIGIASSVAEFVEEISGSFITELVDFRSRFFNFSRMVLTNRSLMSGYFKQFKLKYFSINFAACSLHFTSSNFGTRSIYVSYN